MPTFSISENNKRILLYCRAKKMYVIVNKQVKFLTTQYIGTKGLCPKLSTNHHYGTNKSIGNGSRILRKLVDEYS